jgi:hypothetical protein
VSGWGRREGGGAGPVRLAGFLVVKLRGIGWLWPSTAPMVRGSNVGHDITSLTLQLGGHMGGRGGGGGRRQWHVPSLCLNGSETASQMNIKHLSEVTLRLQPQQQFKP